MVATFISLTDILLYLGFHAIALLQEIFMQTNDLDIYLALGKTWLAKPYRTSYKSYIWQKNHIIKEINSD